MLPTKFRFIWPSGFREEEFKKFANQKQEFPVATMFVNGLVFELIANACGKLVAQLVGIV
jgi:hypothetical protein